MKGRDHWRVFSVIFAVFFIYFLNPARYYLLPYLILGAGINPDIDLYTKIFKHRSWFTHSLLFPLFIYGLLFWIGAEVDFWAFVTLSIATITHLICDLKFAWHNWKTEKRIWMWINLIILTGVIIYVI